MSAADELAELIPHFGIPRRELTSAQRRERSDAVRELTPELAEIYHREVGRVHGLRRVDGVARTDARFLDPDAERFAIEELRARGLNVDRHGVELKGAQLRRRAKSWLIAQADTIADTAGDIYRRPTDRDVQIAYHEAEAIRWREVARLDRIRARQHDEAAASHEAALAALIDGATDDEPGDIDDDFAGDDDR